MNKLCEFWVLSGGTWYPVVAAGRLEARTQVEARRNRVAELVIDIYEQYAHAPLPWMHAGEDIRK